MRRSTTLFIILLVTLSACDSDDSQGTQGPPGSTPTVDTSSIELPVLNDFQSPQDAQGTKLSGVEDKTIKVGHGAAAVLAVERPLTEPRCILAAQFRLYLTQASGLAAKELALYPSHVFDALSKKDGDEFGYAGTALDIRPRATLQNSEPGWSEWDVTDVVKLWLRGGPFPSRGLNVPDQGPIVLTIRDVDGAEPFGTATFISSDGSDRRPYVVVTQRANCDSH